MTGKRGVRAERERGEIEECFLSYRESGDREALAKSLTLAQGELRRVARYYALDASEEDDVVQATVLTAIQRAGSFDSERRLTPWLIGILLKKIATSRRKAWRVSSELEIRSDRTPMTSMEASEIRVLVGEALAHLPAPYRDVLTLHLNEGMGGREIALELDRPQGTIRAQIHRGLRLLRDALPTGLSLGLLGLFRRTARADTPAAGDSRKGPGPGGSEAARLSRAPLRPWVVPSAAIGGVALVGALTWSVLTPGPSDVRASDPASTPVALVGVAPHDESAAAQRDRIALSGAPEIASALPPAPEAAGLRIRVYERLTGAPVADVALRARVETDAGKRLDLYARTDGEGLSVLDMDPGEVERLTLEPRHGGFATLNASWDRSQGARIGDELEIPLHAVRPIGGRVVDSSGAPIVGAELRLATWELVNGGMWRLGDDEHLALTDAEGRWVHPQAPELGGRIILRVFHPDHATELEVRKPRASEALWAREHLIVLEEGGAPVELVIRDSAGIPLPEARITLSTTRRTPRRTLERVADASGRMRFRWPSMKELVVSVRAPGHASRHLRLKRPPDAPVEVTMVAQRELEFVAVDGEGAPLASALLRPFGASWFEAVETDAEGRFTVGLDPEKSLQFDVRQSGVIGATSVTWSPTRETRLVIPTPTEVRGSLVESSSGAALPAASLVVFEGSKPIGTREVTDPGDYLLRFWPRSPSVVVEARALGYQSVRSPELHVVAQDMVWDAALGGVEVIDELVLDHEGRAVDWGEACVVVPGAIPVLVDGTLREELSGVKKIRIHGDGRLTLNRPDAPFALVLVTREGFGWITSRELDAGLGIRVEPWARVEGSLAPGQGSQGAAKSVGLEFDRFALDSDGLGLVMEYVTTTTQEGTFRFKGVPAGSVRVVPLARPASAIEALVAAGDTASVSLR